MELRGGHVDLEALQAYEADGVRTRGARQRVRHLHEVVPAGRPVRGGVCQLGFGPYR